MSAPFISICIPAYKRTAYLKRLLDSIDAQQFRDFEVVITDDSGDRETEELCNKYQPHFPVHYFRNIQPLGTPENWNESIRKSTGAWIKLMHDDDWFASPLSLSVFAATVESYRENVFFYSAYVDVYENDGRVKPVRLNSFRKRKLEKNPTTLLSSNVIGPPSVTLIKRENHPGYDSNTKWVVDIDYYIRVLKDFEPVYISETLIHVGINDEQVTRLTFRNPQIEIPENFYLLDKIGIAALRDILVYDACWRMIRNLKIDSDKMINEYGYTGTIHPVISSMINWQKRIPGWLLRLGPFSKVLMLFHCVFHRQQLK